MTVTVGDSGLCYCVTCFTCDVYRAINCLSSVILSSMPGVGKKIALHVSPAAMNYTSLISTVPTHSAFFLQLFSPISSQWGTVVVEIKVPSSENPKLSTALSSKSKSSFTCLACCHSTPLHFPLSGLLRTEKLRSPLLETQRENRDVKVFSSQTVAPSAHWSV